MQFLLFKLTQCDALWCSHNLKWPSVIIWNLQEIPPSIQTHSTCSLCQFYWCLNLTVWRFTILSVNFLSNRSSNSKLILKFYSLFSMVFIKVNETNKHICKHSCAKFRPHIHKYNFFFYKFLIFHKNLTVRCLPEPTLLY